MGLVCLICYWQDTKTSIIMSNFNFSCYFDFLTALSTKLFYRNFLILILITSCFCCTNKSSNDGPTNSDGSIRTEIVVPAGEIVEGYDKLSIPAFFNIGKIEINNTRLKTIILSTRQDEGSPINITPLAEFSFVNDTILESYLVGYPILANEKKLRFEAYATQHSDIIASVESWFRGQCGISQCRSFTWDNPDKLLMNKF